MWDSPFPFGVTGLCPSSGCTNVALRTRIPSAALPKLVCPHRSSRRAALAEPRGLPLVLGLQLAPFYEWISPILLVLGAEQGTLPCLVVSGPWAGCMLANQKHAIRHNFIRKHYVFICNGSAPVFSVLWSHKQPQGRCHSVSQEKPEQSLGPRLSPH